MNCPLDFTAGFFYNSFYTDQTLFKKTEEIAVMQNKTDWDQIFEARFQRHEMELRWLYMELYHGDWDAWDYFRQMLRRAFDARSEALREIDLRREQNPAWYKGHELVGMLMYVKAFAGNLRGVREKLDYIEDCGVNYLHLMPLLQSPAGRSDGGYAVADFRKVEPELGTMEDLAALAADCHERGIAVCLDFVMNHTSEDHEWARRARAGEKAYQDRYFFFDNWTEPLEYERTVPQVFPTTAPGNFTWSAEAGKVVMTTFYPYQWDLNYANPVVFNDMTENMLYLCNQGIDVIRLDAVPYIWKELGTSCRNLPQVHTLVRMMRMVCEIVCPGCLLLGEVVMEPSKVVPYFGSVERPECHLLYNVTTMASTWHTVATHDVRLLRHQLEQVFALPKEYGFLNYLRCHDDIGWGLDYPFLAQFGVQEVAHKKFLNDYLTGEWPGSDARGELYNNDPRLGDARLCGTTASLCGVETARREGDAQKLDAALRYDEMLHAFMFTMSGLPVLYSGDEIAQENDYSYHADPLKREDSRYLHRGNLNWDAAARRHDPATPEGRLFGSLRRLEQLRAAHRVFDGAADTWLVDTHSGSVLGIGRYYAEEKLIALFNFSAEEKLIWTEEQGEFTDLLTGEAVEKHAITLPAGGFRWLVCDFKAMRRSKPRLVFLDVDGTLTVPGGNTIPQSALDAIRAARENGHRFFLCTGRNLAMLRPLLDYGCFDGAVASDGGYVFHGDEVLFDCPMSAEQFGKAMQLLGEAGVFRTAEAKDATYCDPGEAAFLGEKSGGNSELVRWRTALEQNLGMQPMADYDGRPIYKIVFLSERFEQLKPAIDALQGEFAFTIQEPDALGCLNGELVNRQFDKGRGVRRVAEALGFKLEDTIGFGDSLNDLEMIQTVGLGICMENGSPTLKKFSQMTCPPVEADGLAKVFDALELI